MSDVYMPGLKSRFNSEKIIEDLMRIERAPRDKAEKNIDDLEARKTWWQDLGRRVTSFRESAQMLFSFQNPFNERTAISSNENVITAAATRGAEEGEYQFTVKQLAQADRFLSSPLEEKMSIEAGTYGFTIGKEKVSFNYKGGTLREFTDILNRQGRGKISASFISVQPGVKSLVLESKITGAENRLGFSDDAISLAVNLGIVEREIVPSEEASVEATPMEEIVLGEDPAVDTAVDTALITDENPGVSTLEGIFEQDVESIAANDVAAETASVETASVETASVEAASVEAASIADTAPVSFTYKPVKAVSTAQDAIIEMAGIEMTRPSNVISDIIPSVTITARGVSERPERLEVRPDREGIKDSIISMVGNYNRLMAELNVLLAPMPAVPKKDDVAGSDASARRAAAMRIIDELTYLDKDEVEDMQHRLGAFSGDTSLTQFRSSLLRMASSPYPTDDQYDLSLLAQIGISTNPGAPGRASYNQARMRGYLQIDPNELDSALEHNLPAVRQLFAYDTDGDLLADTGVAYNMDALAKPLDGKEIGGIVSLKTGTIDSRISQDKRRIDTMERQLAAKEADLKIQYSRMESAYDRMERMSSSLDNFGRQNSNNR